MEVGTPMLAFCLLGDRHIEVPTSTTRVPAIGGWFEENKANTDGHLRLYIIGHKYLQQVLATVS